ncbi:AmpG family muropeptide MFS transporter [Lampropedia puyangensis]|uniref:AmpG family muropeptide MFS transporter n=1 Tax=Lampropedia puyangensis TaxID=1330072 RepID=A0A4S8EX95_9BURK|nr:MFS transporter [Lampropedia puyangensis]THT98474.1 AmpG family muropeptide MFS transporter [Lampropedia puyangensis]
MTSSVTARTLLDSLRPYLEKAPLAALLLGITSGFPAAMIGATLTTRLAQHGISKQSVMAFSLAFLAYNLKFLWAPAVDRFRLPVIARFGQRRSWLWFSAAMLVVSLCLLGSTDPATNLRTVAIYAVMTGVAGATLDIVIDAYRIESLSIAQLGAGSGMSQYGWRIGAATAGALALIIAEHASWTVAYIGCSIFVLPALFVTLWLGEPYRSNTINQKKSKLASIASAVFDPLRDFFMRRGAILVLLFVLLHKIGDTLANLSVRLLLEELQFSNTEIATYDILFGFIATLFGIFVGGLLYRRVGLKHSVLISLILMAVSNLSFAVLAHIGHSNLMLAFTMGFENFASGIGGVAIVAYFSAMCNLAFTASQYALLSAAASIAGRLLTGTSAGSLIENFGFINFYLFTTILALPGLLIYLILMKFNFVESSISRP